MSRSNPIPDSLAGRIRSFFAACPDEELTYDDMAVKFGCTPYQARLAVKGLRKRRHVALVSVYERAISATVVRMATLT